MWLKSNHSDTKDFVSGISDVLSSALDDETVAGNEGQLATSGIQGFLHTFMNLDQGNRMEVGLTQLSGTIPGSLFTDGCGMNSVVFRYTRMSGTIPYAFGTCSQMTLVWMDGMAENRFDYKWNAQQLSGTIPDSFAGLSALDVFTLGGYMDGRPGVHPSLGSASLLSGSLPSAFFSLPNLKVMLMPRIPRLGGHMVSLPPRLIYGLMTNAVSMTGSLEGLGTNGFLLGVVITEHDGLTCGSGIKPKDFADKTFQYADTLENSAMGAGEGVLQCGSLRQQRVWNDVFASRLPDGGGPAPQNTGISGTIPHQFHSYVMISLVFDLMKLSGTMPQDGVYGPNISAWPPVDRLKLRGDPVFGGAVSGTLPQELQPSFTEYIDFYHTRISGTFSTQLFKTLKTKYFDLRFADARISGTIPETVSYIQHRRCSLHSNRLSGTTPVNLTYSKITALSLSNNSLSGYLLPSKRWSVPPAGVHSTSYDPPVFEDSLEDNDDTCGHQERSPVRRRVGEPGRRRRRAGLTLRRRDAPPCRYLN